MSTLILKTHFFVILGMHRSGTSFLTRCLNVSGVYLGKNLMSYDGLSKWNPKGNWENRDFFNLSEQLLKQNNGTWDNIPSNIICHSDLKTKFKQVLQKILEDSHLSSGLKDPRTIIILDSIIDIFPENKLLLGIFRHPLKVAQSLKTRNGFDYEKSLNLWKIHNVKLLQYLEKNNGFLFNFDWSKEKMIFELEKFVKKTGLISTDLNSIHSSELLRSDSSYATDYKIPDDIQKTYEKLLERSELNESIVVKPIVFSIEESREIMKKMIQQINELSEVEFK